MNRTVILLLIKKIEDISKIRVIFGVCGEIYSWKSHPFFLEGRNESGDLRAHYLSTPFKGFKFDGLNVRFPKISVISGIFRSVINSSVYRSLFFDLMVTEGITKMAVVADLNFSWVDPTFNIGATNVSHVAKTMGNEIGDLPDTGACFRVSRRLFSCACNGKKIYHHERPSGEDKGVFLAVEVDMSHRTMHFFHQKKNSWLLYYQPSISSILRIFWSTR